MKEIIAALNKFQSEIRSVPKETENPFFKSKYADLATVWDAIRSPLAKHGLAVTQQLGTGEHAPLLTTTLWHTSGESLASTVTITAKDSSPQAFASSVTYLRRVSLSALLGLTAALEDDDGHSATHPTASAQREMMKPTQSAPSRPAGTLQQSQQPPLPSSGPTVGTPWKPKGTSHS